MNDSFTTHVFNIYPNDPDSCMQLLGYLAQNLHEKQILQNLQLNETAFKQYADALLAKAKSRNNDSKSNLWEYITKKWKHNNGYAVPVFTGGLTGAFIFGGPWGAAGGAVVGGVGEAVRQQLYHTDNYISQDLKDAYAFLGISSSANNEEVEKAYREKSRLYHPDKAGVADVQSQLNISVNLIRDSRSNKANLDEFEVVTK